MEGNVKPLTESTDIVRRIKRVLGDHTICPLCNEGFVTVTRNGWKHNIKCSKCNKNLLVMFKEGPFEIIKIMEDENDIEFPEVTINQYISSKSKNEIL